jgi:hypothetical protein
MAPSKGRAKMMGYLNTYTHAEGTAKVIENDPGARVARVIHFGVWLRGIFGLKQQRW